VFFSNFSSVQEQKIIIRVEKLSTTEIQFYNM